MSTALLPRQLAHRDKPLGLDTLIAAAVAGWLVIWFSATTPNVLHWFIVPVLVCALLIGGDAVRWLRGRVDFFDPAGVVGLLGFYLFFVAPMLHVRWDYWMRFVTPPPDWRDWLGAMALLNCLGLVAYRAARAWIAHTPRLFHHTRVIDPRRFWIMLPLALLLAGAAQYAVYARVGGLLGYVRAYERPDASFQGFGIVFLLSESFPIVAMMGFAVLAARKPQLSSWFVLLLVMIAFFALKILFGGLRGSRSNTVWGLFWAAGMVHLWVRPLPRRALLAALPLLAAFMFGYGFYKAAGLEGLSALLEPARAREIAEESGRTFNATMLSDLGRADVQAYTLYRLQNGASQELGWGRTYLGGLAILIPRSVYPGRPETKVKEGTDITYGRGTFDSGRISTRVYGLAGEALLNVGMIGVPVVFFLWGLLVGLLRAAYYGFRRGDARLLMLPFWVNFAIVALIGDSDNWVFFLFKEGTVPLLLLLMCSRLVRLPGEARTCA